MKDKRQIIHERDNQQFTLPLEDGLEAKVIYTLDGDTMRLTYSEVPRALRGQGIGEELVLKTFEKLTEEGYKAIGICGYIRAVARRNEKWRDIIQ